jgi:HlyD family secretion protein
MKHRKLWIAAAVVVAVIVAVAWLSRPKPILVETVKADLGVVAETVTNTRAGTVKACQRARLAPPMGGQIDKLPVKKGDHVRKDQVLLELWNDDLRAALELAQRGAVAARAQADQACVTAQVARRDADRVGQLLERKLVAPDAVDRARGEADSNEAACRAATENIKVAQARVDQAAANLERTLLRAPFDGIVAEINGELGEFVTPSPVGIPTPPAVDLVDISCIYVTAPIDEVDAPRIREGMPARVTLDAFRNQSFPAHVRRVAPYVLDVEKQARTVEVEAELEKQEGVELLPGYSADVEVIVDEHPDALRIPTRALLEGKYVYVLDPKDGRIHKREIHTGLGNWENTEVLEGLKQGEQVVTSVDRTGLADGVPARVQAQ